MPSNQHSAVIATLRKLGGVATLDELYQAVPKDGWKTSTPDATIRRIVQTQPAIYRIKPGLYALASKRAELEAKAGKEIQFSQQIPRTNRVKESAIVYSTAVAQKEESLTQAEMVVHALERLGGLANLGDLYREVPSETWITTTPFASIRRIVQLTPQIYKLRPGLYGLVSRRAEFEAKGIIAETAQNKNSTEQQALNHTHYQGLLLQWAKIQGFDCWSPNQDKNKLFQNAPLGSLRTLQKLPAFSHEGLVRRSSTIDVIWFKNQMPEHFFEVEHSTDIQNSLIKFSDLRHFNSSMVIVADGKRRAEFERKRTLAVFREIGQRVKFLSYDKLRRDYEHANSTPKDEFTL